LIEPQNDHRFGQARLTLNDFDSHHGVILLGDLGMGKSTEFDAATDGIDERHCISAREFRRYDPDEILTGESRPSLLMDLMRFVLAEESQELSWIRSSRRSKD